jgi:hypothetical protein
MWEGQEMAGMAVVVLVGSMSMAPATAAADGIVPNASHTPHTSHVRSEDVAIMKFVERAREASETFRRLVDTIDASDGLVYIQEGRCPNNARACFIGVTAAGRSRTLWVRVNLRIKRPDWEVMGSIAHELHHAVEVLEVPSIRSTAAMYLFYRNVGFRATPPSYETLPALDAGYAVGSEVRSHSR